MEEIKSPLSIKKIIQEDNKNFSISWNDGKKSIYRIDHLQYHCPCIKCKSLPCKELSKDLSVVSIKSVGNYAIKIQFTKGCSQGIYTYEYLKKIPSC